MMSGSAPPETLVARAMEWALSEAQAAWDEDEVPVGAVVLGPDGALLSRAHNEILSRADPTAHAERLVITRACQAVGAPRLPRGSLLASTLEPCALCAGALVLARIDWLVFGALDPKTGACGSLWDVVRDPRLNHCVSVLPRRQEAECGSLLSRFFQSKR